MYQIKTFKAVNPMFEVTARMTSAGDWYVSIDNTQSGESLLRVERASAVNFNQHTVMIDGYLLRVLSGSTSYLTRELQQLVLTAFDYTDFPDAVDHVGQIVTPKLNTTSTDYTAKLWRGTPGIITRIVSAPPVYKGGPQTTVCTVAFKRDRVDAESEVKIAVLYLEDLLVTETQPDAIVLEFAAKRIAES